MNKDIRILNREETVLEIQKMIYYAKESLILISPYVSLTEEYKKELKRCIAKEKILIHRENAEIKDIDFLEKIGFKTAFVKNLHSKIYINDNWIIFSSMNLYHYSIENNFETSIMIREKALQKKDTKVIMEILKNIRK